MKGFNYTTQSAFDLPVAVLREDLQTIVNSGGRRRVEADNDGAVTYAHASDGTIAWEAYGNVTITRRNQPDLIEEAS